MPSLLARSSRLVRTATAIAAIGALALVTTTAATPPLNAQNTTPPAATARRGELRGELRGTVVAAGTNAPIAGARIEIRAVAATAGAAADSLVRANAALNGTFRLGNLRAGTFRLRVSAIGFALRDLPNVTIGSTTVDLGTIALTAAAVELSSVVVRDKKGDVELAPDRNAYVVKEMPSTRGGTALDVLRNVPAVDVDIDNIVSLRGNSGVIIQINGRPSPMKAGQMGNFLAQLPADVVERIEVVSNPSAREDPTGVAGIINIVLKQEAEAGTSGGFSLGGITTGQQNIGVNYGYDRGPLSLFGSYGLINDHRNRSEKIWRDNLYVVPTTTYLNEFGTRGQKPLMHTVTGSATYQLSKKDELSAELLFSTRTEPEIFDVRYNTLSAARTLQSAYNRYTDGLNHEGEFEVTLGYKHSFAEKGHRFTAEARFNQGGEGGPTSVIQRALALDGTLGAVQAQEHSTPWAHPNDADVKVDYARPLSKTVRFEAGYKGSLVTFHSTLDTRVLDITRNVMVPDSTRIGDVTFDQWVHAGYSQLSAQLGKFTVQGGVRLEHAATTFTQRTTGGRFNSSYDEAYPSGLVIYHVDDDRQVKLSYSTRIRRPDDTDVLDPTPHILDPLNISRGNPYLKPEIIRAFELGMQQTAGRVTVQVTPYFRRTFDAIRSIRTIDAQGVSTRTYANIATSDASGLDLTFALGGGGRWSGFASGSAYKQQSNATNVAQGLNVNTFGWAARTNLTYRVSRTVDAQSLVTYQAPMDVEQGHNEARTRVSFAARQKFLDDQLSVTLRVLDPFSTSAERSTTIDPRFDQISERARHIRGVGLTVSWTFGKPDRDRSKNDLIGEPPAA